MAVKGEPDNTLKRDDLREKVQRMVGYARAQGLKFEDARTERILEKVFALHKADSVKGLLL
jgi:hypothetical protein